MNMCNLSKIAVATTIIAAMTVSASLAGSIAAPYEIGTWAGFRPAAISYTYDDNCANQYNIAIPMFTAMGFKMTLFTIINRVQGTDWTSMSNAAAAGHEIASHTVTHFNLWQLSDERQLTELTDSQNIINANVTSQKCLTLAYPNGVGGNESLVSQYYIAARTGTGQLELSTPTNFMQISSVICGSSGTVQTLQDFTNVAASAIGPKGWCVYLFHGIDDDGGYSPIPSTTLQASLDYFSANQDKYWVNTFGNVVRYIKERNAVSVTEASSSSSRITVQVTDGLDNSIYNYPITLRRPLPAGWPGATVSQNSTPLTTQIVSLNSTNYVVFDVVPDGGDVIISKPAWAGGAGAGLVSGDSTVATFAGGTQIADFLYTPAQINAGWTVTSIAVPGHTIANQKATYLSTGVRTNADYTLVQIGLNDLNPGEASGVAIARLQDYIDTINVNKKPGSLTIISTMIPARQAVIDAYGSVEGPVSQQKYLDINNAIKGMGPTPITGVVSRISNHTALLDDGSGNLAPAYDTGDHVHENNTARLIIARVWRDSLAEIHLLDPDVPAEPIVGTALAGDGSAMVSFAPPQFNGGAPVTSYTVTSSPGSMTASGASSPLTVTGLTNGISYTFTVMASNEVGLSGVSSSTIPVIPGQEDLNLNGLPDTWEIQNFGSTNAVNGGAEDDWDHDGMNNQAEYRAGTCPTNASSILKIANLAPDNVSATGMVLRWSSVTGKSYSIQSSTNLLTGFDGWTTYHILATSPMNTHTVGIDQLSDRYYRVTVE